jgi:putative flippase GtrA
MCQSLAAIPDMKKLQRFSPGSLYKYTEFRFLIVGLANTAFGYLAYVAFLYFGFSFYIASLLSLLIGICFSFLTQSFIVFQRPGFERFARFAVAWLLVYGVNIGIIFLLLQFGLNAYLGGLCAMVVVVPVSFLVQKHFVFSISEPAAGE